MSKQIRIVVDYENSAGAWWTISRVAARREIQHVSAAERTLPVSCERLFEDLDAVTVSAEDAEAFKAWASALPGWSDGPTFAPHPFTFADVE